MQQIAEVCKKSYLNSGFKADIFDFGGISNRIRRKTLDDCNLRKIFILFQNCNAWMLSQALNMGNFR